MSDDSLQASTAGPPSSGGHQPSKSKKTKVPKTMAETKVPIYQRLKNPAQIKDPDSYAAQLLKKNKVRVEDAAHQAALAELLLPEEEGFLEAENLERTQDVSQKELRNHVDINTAAKMFNLNLTQFGPYCIDYTRNGSHLLIGGRKGHLAAFRWQTGKLLFETQVRESVKAVKWLHNETMLAVAQKKYVYIYDNQGLEIHCLRHHGYPNALEFLPHHFLLASVGDLGRLVYQDVSTGDVVQKVRTKLGPCQAMSQNPWNAVINLGHANGTVTMWSPATDEPLAKMKCHRGPIRCMAVDPSGHYLATGGMDGCVKLWDIRMYNQLQEFQVNIAPTDMSISQRRLLALGTGPLVTVWKGAFTEGVVPSAPYMRHRVPRSQISGVRFCPYEDVLGIGHASGFSSLVIPGAGEPNFDSHADNPFETKTQRQEKEVRQLLDKLQPNMISLNPSHVASFDPTSLPVLEQEYDELRKEDHQDTHGPAPDQYGESIDNGTETNNDDNDDAPKPTSAAHDNQASLRDARATARRERMKFLAENIEMIRETMETQRIQSRGRRPPMNRTRHLDMNDNALSRFKKRQRR
ncbi:putative U3 small nucleolar RNA-associated protein 7 [Dimargaris verticillata]|uniref:U three protein 7 n=1 Tax=Dimargaris verticillata TaxID=2761393 RepID=A0A9W8BB56_9FUNG|nr:putative U3 small nucleolar RNA-associated protein 7 [Dimargaris verticillata]